MSTPEIAADPGTSLIPFPRKKAPPVTRIFGNRGRSRTPLACLVNARLMRYVSTNSSQYEIEQQQIQAHKKFLPNVEQSQADIESRDEAALSRSKLAAGAQERDNRQFEALRHREHARKHEGVGLCVVVPLLS